MTQGERIKDVRKALGLTLEKFGERVGVTKQTVSRIENGVNNLTEQMTKSICREFSVDYLWLTTGEGEMFVENDFELMEIIDRILMGDNEFHKKLLKWCATSLSDDDLQRLEKKIDEFVAEFSKGDKDHCSE